VPLLTITKFDHAPGFALRVYIDIDCCYFIECNTLLKITLLNKLFSSIYSKLFFFFDLYTLNYLLFLNKFFGLKCSSSLLFVWRYKQMLFLQ